jgi:hypothetical protein
MVIIKSSKFERTRIDIKEVIDKGKIDKVNRKRIELKIKVKIILISFFL